LSWNVILCAGGDVRTAAVEVRWLSDGITREVAVDLPDEPVRSADILVYGERFLVDVATLTAAGGD
jgi:hypothetical protein